MKLKPLGNAFLFSFCSETSSGQFIERNSGRIILTNGDMEGQGKYARWGKVRAIGEDVKDFSVNDIVLIESLQWTKQFKFEGMTYWKSDQTKVIAIARDETVTYAY